MKADYLIPPLRDLPPGRLAERKQHLLGEIADGPKSRVSLPMGVHSPLRAPALVATLVAAVVAMMMIAPWQGDRGGVVERALAAVGHGPVLHVVTEQPSPYGYYQPISLMTGQPIPVTSRKEVWFDQNRDLKKTISTVNGIVFEEVLETAEGAFTPSGPVFTCAWIGAHPIAAKEAGVSCNSNTQDGTTAPQISEQSPKLDLALAGFVDRYRSALASGQAREIGTGRLDGRHVIWLRITSAASPDSILPETQEVAIDAASYAPLLVRSPGSSNVELRVVAINTQPYAPARFTRPTVAHSPSSGRVLSSSPIELAETSRVLGGQALWLGHEWQGLRLVAIKQEELTTGYGPLSELNPKRSFGVVFGYARVKPDGTTDTRTTISIREARQCELAYGWSCTARDPSGDTMIKGPPAFASIFQRDGLYISISQTSVQPSPVEVAKELQPAPGSTSE